MSNFTFLAVGHDMFPDHTYLLDGVRLPSVTEIIDYAFDTYAGVPKDLLERAKLFGNAVHKTVELYLLNDLDESTLDEPLVKPLEAFKVWTMDHPEFDLNTAAIERPGYHPKLKYAGTPDIDCSAVIDLKSRKCNPLTDALQLLFYDHMTGNGKRPNYVLELRQDGTYVFTGLNMSPKARALNWSRCRYLLDYYKMGKEIERWKTQ